MEPTIKEKAYSDRLAAATILGVCSFIGMVVMGFYLENAWEEKVAYTTAYEVELATLKEEKAALEQEIQDMEARHRSRLATVEPKLNLLDRLMNNKEQPVELEPYRPTLALSDAQESLCLALGMYSEDGGSSLLSREWLGWSIISRAEDSREDFRFRPSTCGVLSAGKDSQYNAITPYLGALRKIVWGDITDYTPEKAKANAQELKAWLDTKRLAEEIVAGQHTRKTTANHYISFQSMSSNRFPNWVADLRPSGTQGLHVYFSDFGLDKNGKRMYYTAEKPYRPYQ